jgi:predicted small lipoprotein YifL
MPLLRRSGRGRREARGPASCAGIILALAACGAPGPAAAPPGDAVQDRAFYVCVSHTSEETITVDFFEQAARVFVGGDTARLPRLPGEDRYGDDDVELRVDGRAATLTRDGRPLDCHAEGTGDVWRDAIRRGVVFRALGQEPGWMVEIEREGTMVVLLDYGTERIEVETPVPDADGDRVEYRFRAGDREVRIMIEPSFCRDTMSGEAFPAAVTLHVDGRSYPGCGLRLS